MPQFVPNPRPIYLSSYRQSYSPPTPSQIRRLLFALIGIGITNTFFLLFELSRQPVVGVISDHYLDRPNVIDASAKSVWLSIEETTNSLLHLGGTAARGSLAYEDEDTPFFDLPEQLRKMTLAKETMTASAMPQNQFSGSSEELKGVRDSLSPIRSVVTITRVENGSSNST